MFHFESKCLILYVLWMMFWSMMFLLIFMADNVGYCICGYRRFFIPFIRDCAVTWSTSDDVDNACMIAVRPDEKRNDICEDILGLMLDIVLPCLLQD